MYLRYRAQFFNAKTQQNEFGFFAAAEYLKLHADLAIEERTELEKLIDWFDNTLPIPDYYQDERNRQSAKAATSWFKDTAKKFIKGMNKLAAILEQNHISVERIHEKKLMGKVIYEDEFQLTILPYRDVAKGVK